MVIGENLFDNLLTLIILLTLGLIVYLKIAKKSLPEFISEIREVTREDELHE